MHDRVPKKNKHTQEFKKLLCIKFTFVHIIVRCLLLINTCVSYIPPDTTVEFDGIYDTQSGSVKHNKGM
jgi:hypothetical protein